MSVIVYYVERAARKHYQSKALDITADKTKAIMISGRNKQQTNFF